MRCMGVNYDGSKASPLSELTLIGVVPKCMPSNLSSLIQGEQLGLESQSSPHPVR